MDWKLEGSVQRTESPELQGQEGILEDIGEDGLSESFQLLQIDVECDCQDREPLPTNSTTWCSKNVQRKQRHWEKIVAAKKSKRKQEKERRKANRAENPGICPQHSKRFLRSLTKEKLLEAKHSGPRLCIDLSMTHHMSKKVSRLAGQIRRLYGSNKKVDRPFWICLTGFMTDSPLYEECLRMNDGFLLDKEEDCFSLFPLETLVYLTPDSEHALQDVDLNKVYVLGGLVDESIQKVSVHFGPNICILKCSAYFRCDCPVVIYPKELRGTGRKSLQLRIVQRGMRAGVGCGEGRTENEKTFLPHT
uniref:tRNA (guanine(9)-N(1))-methyltransferase n=1 Tax=Sciurus vulgaris TaxID=55149 RepID=A0A8D2DA96_SCIVU